MDVVDPLFLNEIIYRDHVPINDHIKRPQVLSILKLLDDNKQEMKANNDRKLSKEINMKQAFTY